MSTQTDGQEEEEVRIPINERLAMLWDAGTWGWYPEEWEAWRKTNP